MPIAEERPAPNIAGQFVQVEDPRGEQGKQHRLDDIISWLLPSVRSSVEPMASRPSHSLVKLGRRDGEDDSRIRDGHAPQNMATLQRLAPGLLR